MQGMKQWNSAEAERPSLLWSAILEASREPEVWGRLMRALGPGLMAGAYEFRIENRPELVETMRQVRIELESAEGEARLKLEAELEELQEAISAIDRIPVPSTPARKTWEMLRPLLEKISDAEAEAEGPATD